MHKHIQIYLLLIKQINAQNNAIFVNIFMYCIKRKISDMLNTAFCRNSKVNLED